MLISYSVPLYRGSRIPRLSERGRPTLRGRTSKVVISKKKTTVKLSSEMLNDIQRILDIYPRNGIENIAEKKEESLEYCIVCNNTVSVDSTRSELHCNDQECGAVRLLVGTMFEDNNFYNQEGNKSKSGTFNPNRHFQFWWVHLLAREPEEEIGTRNDVNNQYGEQLLANIRRIIIRDNRILQLLTVMDIRNMLRELGKSSLNKNIPLIMKKLTGIGPPQIPDSISVKIENLFSKSIEIAERIRNNGRVNRNYYPYYIYKILDHVLPKNDIINRRVMFYIYIQSKETVESNDEDWELICNELEEIPYTPTDRTEYLNYNL